MVRKILGVLGVFLAFFLEKTKEKKDREWAVPRTRLNGPVLGQKLQGGSYRGQFSQRGVCVCVCVFLLVSLGDGLGLGSGGWLGVGFSVENERKRQGDGEGNYPLVSPRGSLLKIQWKTAY